MNWESVARSIPKISLLFFPICITSFVDDMLIWAICGIKSGVQYLPLILNMKELLIYLLNNLQNKNILNIYIFMTKNDACKCVDYYREKDGNIYVKQKIMVYKKMNGCVFGI